jgi:peptide/nickel transport system permease protein
MIRTAAACLLVLLAALALFAGTLSPYSYEAQDRESPSLAPSSAHPLGTDELGRDRFSRLLHGARVSLLLAPAAAALSLLIAVAAGLIAGIWGGPVEQILSACADLFSSMPWLFLLLIVRAMLPLDVSAYTSVGITFLLLGLLGWPAAMRVVRSATQEAKHEGFLLQARAMGISSARLWILQYLPTLRPVAIAQFWISVPLYILSEANLGILGLGVTEPLPSWGNLLFELSSHRTIVESPWLLAPAVCLVAALLAMQGIRKTERHPAQS